MNHTLHDAFDADYGGGDPKPKKLNAVQKYFDYNDDGKISNFEIGLGVVDLGVTIFDIVSIPSGEGVATHLALKQSAKALTTKTVVKTGMKLLNQFNSAESLIKGAGILTKVKGGMQGFVKGDGPSIFKAITNGGTRQANGTILMKDGTTIFNHFSTKTGVYTIDINKAGQIFKIRIGK